jgi:dehydrogenase/reductase SDR family protein 7B
VVSLQDMDDSKKKVVVITGGSSGIGLACAFKFGRMGYNVCISARNEARLREAESQLNEAGITVEGVVGDVGVEEDCKRMIDAAVSRFGRLDVLINNAGISMRAFFKDLDISVIRRLMETNFFGTLYCTKFGMDHLLETKGSVVGVSSVAGYQGLPGRTGYSASKFAMEGFLKALRLENHNTGLHVMIVCPGYTESNIRKTALVADGSKQGESPREENKMMTAEEVADHIYNGVVARKKRVVLTTQGKLSYFLSKFLPGLVDKLVIKTIEKEGNISGKK